MVLLSLSNFELFAYGLAVVAGAAGTELDSALLVDELAGSVLPAFASAFSAASDVSGLRESLTYQPEPLNTIPTGYNRRFTLPEHSGQMRIGSSFMF